MTTTDVLDALADVYDALGPVTRDDLTALAADPKLLVHVAKTAEKGIRDSCPEKHLPYLETEAAQRAYKALVEGSFETSREERKKAEVRDYGKKVLQKHFPHRQDFQDALDE
jgi:hypothetical protein